MEKRFRIFLTAVIVLAAAVMTAGGIMTFSGLRDAQNRLDRKDRAVFAALAETLADPERVAGVQVQVDSTMGDYRRYAGFDKSLLAGLTFVHHEYLYGGTGSPGEDMTITVNLRQRELPALLAPLLRFWDETFGTGFTHRTETLEMHRDGDVFRVRFGGVSFTAACPAMTAWLAEREAAET